MDTDGTGFTLFDRPVPLIEERYRKLAEEELQRQCDCRESTAGPEREACKGLDRMITGGRAPTWLASTSAARSRSTQTASTSGTLSLRITEPNVVSRPFVS